MIATLFSYIYPLPSYPPSLSPSLSPLPSPSLSGVWQPLEKLLRSWAVNFTTIHVILGSVFDTNRDGERDSDHQYNWWMRNKEGGVAVPTHFYVIAVKCDVIGGMSIDPSLCGPEHLTAMGLVLQHTSDFKVCTVACFCKSPGYNSHNIMYEKNFSAIFSPNEKFAASGRVTNVIGEIKICEFLSQSTGGNYLTQKFLLEQSRRM